MKLKIYLSAIIVICVMLFASCGKKIKETPIEYFEMEGTAIVKYIGSETNVVIPKSVTSIGYSAFAANNTGDVKLESVIIPDTVTTIGEWAFVSNHLTNVVIPKSVTNIGKGAFADNKLETVIISDSLTRIEERTFEGNQLKSVIIPNGVTVICRDAFKQNQLTSITIGSSVAEIEGESFASNKLETVNIPDNVKKIQWHAFANNQLTGAVIGNGVTTIGLGAFYNNKLKNLVIGNGVKEIHEAAFAENQLESVTVPDSVVEIGENAFASNNLRTVNLGSGVSLIRSGAFRDNQLTAVDIPNSVTAMGSEVFAGNPEYSGLESEKVVKPWDPSLGVNNGIIKANMENTNVPGYGIDRLNTSIYMGLDADYRDIFETFEISGSYEGGILTVNLPQMPDPKYLRNILKVFYYRQFISDENANYLVFTDIQTLDNNGSATGSFKLSDDSQEINYTTYYVSFCFVDRDVTVEGGAEGNHYKMNLKKGWNNVFMESSLMTGNSVYSTEPLECNLQWKFEMPH